MSINHFIDKIKGKSDIDITTLVCLLVIVLVGLGSFGLGRLSMVQNNASQKYENPSSFTQRGEPHTDKNFYISVPQESNNKNVEGKTELDLQNVKEKMYVASKNGKLYYSRGCSGAKRIAPANEVWFASSSDAEKSGYTLAKSCK